MRRISASYIFPVATPPLKYGIIRIDPSGEILSLTPTGGILAETSSLEYFNGILIPGLMVIRLGTEAVSGASARYPWGKGLQSEILVTDECRERTHGENPCTEWPFAREESQQIMQFQVSGKILQNSPEDSPDLKNKQEGGAESSLTRIIQHKMCDLQGRKSEKTWFLITKNTLKLFDEMQLHQFFRNNLRNFLYGWENPDPLELTGFLKHFANPGKGITLQDALLPLTTNPAEFAGVDHFAGALDKGKKPGICLLEGVDFRNMSLFEGAAIRRLA